MALPNRALLQTRYVPHRLDAELPIEHGSWSSSDEPIRALDRHDVLELGLCLDGAGTYVVEDKVMPYQAGSLVVLSDAECHYSSSAPGTASRWATVFVRPAELVGGVGPDRQVLSTRELCGPGFGNVLPSAAHPELFGLFRALLQEIPQRGSTGHEAAVRGLVWAIMAQLHRLPGTMPPGAPAMESLARIAPALDRIKSGYAEPLTLPELAAGCGMSERSFCRHFRTAVGEAPMQFLIRHRIEKACERLACTRESVLDISLDVGFNSLGAFNRHFRELTGRTPREWRAGR